MKHQKQELMQEQKPRIEKYLNYNFNNIKSVTLTDTYTNPTGVTHIKGYVNGDEKLTIDAPLSSKHGVEVVDTSDELFDDYLKEKYRFNVRSVSDIEAEEKENGKETSSTDESKKERSVAEIIVEMKAFEENIFKNSNRRNNDS
ncbi:DUF1433 domain-containing protein [Listeria kieliensis]|uniref:DUF1433 domain-containing protein n=1 Tax=Listeria kieliensis TaxID=1621700 RepID=UPI000E217B05|nr:DUF1433 domain-containing protein [Listeria kieliensis]